MDAKNRKKPGETVFAILLSVVSFFLLYEAFGISGFEALSSPGSLPMAAAFLMVVSSVLVLLQTLSAEKQQEIQFWEDILPPVILVMVVFICLFAFALVPLGFIPTAFLFLTASIFALRKKGFFYSLAVSAFALVVIYVLFRLVFSVLMPEGVVPEREILAWIEALFVSSEKP